MLEKLALLEEKYVNLEQQLADPELYNDPNAAAKLLKEQKDLTPIVEAYRAYRKSETDMNDAREMLDGKLDPEMRELAQEEFTTAKEEMARLEQELKILLLPTDPNDDKNVIVEIRAGAGGEEAPLDLHDSNIRSAGFISISTSSTSGRTATVAVEVCIRPCDSVSGTR